MTLKRSLQIIQSVSAGVLIGFLIWQIMYSDYESTKSIFRILLFINLAVVSASIITNRKERQKSSPQTIIMTTGATVLLTIIAVASMLFSSLKKII